MAQNKKKSKTARAQSNRARTAPKTNDKPKAFLDRTGEKKTLKPGEKPILTHETKNPATTIVCNLREQLEMPWVFKMGSEALEETVDKAKEEYNERKGDWTATIGEEIVKHTNYSPLPEAPFSFGNLNLGNACALVFDAICEEYNIGLEPPRQKMLSEHEAEKAEVE